MIEDKRGNVLMMILMFAIIFVVLMVGVIFLVSSSIFTDASNSILPVLKDSFSGMSAVNISADTTPVIDTTQNIVDSFSWLWGIGFFLAITFIFVLAVAFNITSSRFLLGLWLALSILLIVFSIVISNIVEDMTTGTTSLGAGMQNQTLLYYLIVNSPLIFTIVAFISGVIVFSGMGKGENDF